MLNSHVTANCIVPRAVWGQFLPMPVMVGPGGGKLSVVNGANREQVELKPAQGQIAIHHELAECVSDDYVMYCKFCGEVGTQAEWSELLRRGFIAQVVSGG